MRSSPPNQGQHAIAEGRTVGRYRLLKVIGTGGMGSVYEAVHTTLGLRVAIKTLKPAMAENTVTSQRFLREGVVAARVRHPNAVAVYDVIDEGAASYLVMEYLEGETLKDLLDREITLPYERAIDLLLPVLSAVSAAHDEDIVHRDIKPSNLFLARERTGIVAPKVLDFGLSWAADEERPAGDITRSGVVLGTLLYMAPEQVRNARQASAASDQYALGLILYQCVTGHKPFVRATQYDMMNAIVAGEHPPPRALNPELPAALDAVIERAIHVDPSLRFPSVTAFARALQKFASPAVQWLWAPVFDTRPPELSAPAPLSSLPALVASVASSSPSQPPPVPNPIPNPIPGSSSSPSRAVLLGGLACLACLALGVVLGASVHTAPRAPVHAPTHHTVRVTAAASSSSSSSPSQSLGAPSEPSPASPTTTVAPGDAATPPTAPSMATIAPRGVQPVVQQILRAEPDALAPATAAVDAGVYVPRYSSPRYLERTRPDDARARGNDRARTRRP